MTEQKPHLLKNGHPAHILTTEDRRKAAGSTNAARRLKREIAEDEKLSRQADLMLARDEERRARKREQERRRRETKRLEEPTSTSRHLETSLPVASQGGLSGSRFLTTGRATVRVAQQLSKRKATSSGSNR
jgi:hypothetical protein